MSDYYQVQLQKGVVLEPPPHPDACETEEEFLDYVGSRDGVLAADLFCGAGGLSVGLEEAGIQTVIGVDFDDYALNTYRSLFGGLALNRDLSDETAITEVADLIKKAGAEIIAGGPPCQPFSRAGRATIRNLVRQGIRDSHDHRRDLWQAFLEIVARVQPRAVLIENVPDMALGDEGVILRLIVADLEAQGYAVKARLVDAWRYGVPQHRQRLIIVALADAIRFEWPDEVARHPSVNEAISDLPPIEGGWAEAGPGVALPYESPLTDFQSWVRKGIPPSDVHTIHDHVTRSVRDDDREIFASMDADTRYTEIDPDLKRYRDDIFDDKYKRLSGSDLSRTIIAHLAKDGYGFIHPEQDRTISIREAARLQTFPDRVRFAGPPTAQLRQIGNAVPPFLGRSLGTALLNSLEAAEPDGPSTNHTSAHLATWFNENGVGGQIWLEGQSKWSVRLGEALLSPDDPHYFVAPVWGAIRDLTDPADVVSRVSDLSMLASTPSRREDVARVVEAARLATEGKPFKEDAAWRLANLASPESDRTVLYTNRGVLRVVARVSGTPVDRTNQGSDGRIAIARLVGVEPDARPANLALVVIAQSICLPAEPRCGECPLEDVCESSHDFQRQMSFQLAD